MNEIESSNLNEKNVSFLFLFLFFLSLLQIENKLVIFPTDGILLLSLKKLKHI